MNLRASARRSLRTGCWRGFTAVRAPIGVAALALSWVAAVGCGASVSVGGTPSVNNPDKLVSDGLLQAVGRRPVSVSCPSNVEAKVGHVFHCKVVINSAGKYVVATVTETKINASHVHVNIVDGKRIY
jgi:Domain of unknown function (DUF4333)